MNATKPHNIDTVKSPTHVLVMCSCGWRHQESRRQNARARAAKVTAAINKHLAAVRRRGHVGVFANLELTG